MAFGEHPLGHSQPSLEIAVHGIDRLLCAKGFDLALRSARIATNAPLLERLCNREL
jgi:hypothetical protein